MKTFSFLLYQGNLCNNLDFKHIPNSPATLTTCCFLQALLAGAKHVLFLPAKLMLHFGSLAEQRVDTVSTWRCQLAHFTMTATTSSKEPGDVLTSFLGIELLANPVGSCSSQEKLTTLPHQRCKRLESEMGHKAFFNARVEQKLEMRKEQIKSLLEISSLMKKHTEFAAVIFLFGGFVTFLMQPTCDWQTPMHDLHLYEEEEWQQFIKKQSSVSLFPTDIPPGTLQKMILKQTVTNHLSNLFSSSPRLINPRSRMEDSIWEKTGITYIFIIKVQHGVEWLNRK